MNQVWLCFYPRMLSKLFSYCTEKTLLATKSCHLFPALLGWNVCMTRMSRLVPVSFKTYRISYQIGGIFSSKMATSRLWPNSAPSFNRELRELIRYVKIVSSNENSYLSPKLEPMVEEMNCLGTHPALIVLCEIPVSSVGIPLWKVSGIWHPAYCSLKNF